MIALHMNARRGPGALDAPKIRSSRETWGSAAADTAEAQMDGERARAHRHPFDAEWSGEPDD
jgi:hypothetical protein